MIVDVHSHNFPDSIALRAMARLCVKTADWLWPVGDGTLENHLDHLDLAGVDKAVSCPIATKPNMFDGIFRTALAIRDGEFGARAQRKIIPFVSVHPFDPDVMDHLDAIADEGIKGVKFHCFYQDFSLADRSVWPVFARIADLGLVVQCHCGVDLSWPNDTGNCGPREVETLLKNVRGIKFIAAHLGGCGGYSPHATDALLECGCYADTSVLHSTWSLDEQMRLLRSWPTERLLFGTDFPWAHYPEAMRWVESVREPEDLPAIFGGNACRLLSI